MFVFVSFCIFRPTWMPRLCISVPVVDLCPHLLRAAATERWRRPRPSLHGVSGFSQVQCLLPPFGLVLLFNLSPQSGSPRYNSGTFHLSCPACRSFGPPALSLFNMVALAQPDVQTRYSLINLSKLYFHSTISIS